MKGQNDRKVGRRPEKMVAHEQIINTDEEPGGFFVTIHKNHMIQCSYSQALLSWNPFLEYIFYM